MRASRDVTVLRRAVSVVEGLYVIDFRLIVSEHGAGMLEGDPVFGLAFCKSHSKTS
jgi:hypothetical protein